MYPDFDKVKEFANSGEYKRIPISYEILSDNKTPIEILKKLQAVSKYTFLLESLDDFEDKGRYTFLAYDPIVEISCLNGILEIKGDSTFTKSKLLDKQPSYVVETINPGSYIRQIIAENKAPVIDSLPPFTGGLMGYFGYDYKKYVLENYTLDLDSFSVTEKSIIKANLIQHQNNDLENKVLIKDLNLKFFNKIIAIDNYNQKIVFIFNMKVSDDPDILDKNYKKAIIHLKKMVKLVIEGKSRPNKGLKLKSSFNIDLSPEEYSEMVNKATDYINKGEISSLVLSNKINANIRGSILDAYRVFRTKYHSHHMFYFSTDFKEFFGASPESLVKLNSGKIATFPMSNLQIKNHDLDLNSLDFTEEISDYLDNNQNLENILKDSQNKHDFLIDTGKFVLSKIANEDSLNLEELKEIKDSARISYMVSKITANLSEEHDYLSLIESLIPASVLSGNNKKISWEIINELENSKRGIYGGLVGYISLSGNLDFSTPINLCTSYKSNLQIFSGANIFEDSVGEDKFIESLQYAKLMLDSVKTASDGII